MPAGCLHSHMTCTWSHGVWWSHDLLFYYTPQTWWYWIVYTV